MRLGICAAVALLLGSGAAPARSGAPPVPRPSFEIYSIRVDGTGIRNLTNSPLDEDSPAVSPNGRQIAIIRATAGNRDLWVMNADGSGQKQLTSSAAEDEGEPEWSPGGTSIAYTTATRDVCPPNPCPSWSVRVVHPDGTGLREVVAGGRDARWSPNGRRLVLETDIDPYQEAESISVARLGGGVGKVVKTAGVVAHPVWSRDGRLAFLWDRGGAADLYVSHADGRARRRVAKGAEAPEWSPSGRQIAFLALARLKIVGVGTRRVRSVARANGFAWSRSGRRLALFREQGRIAVVKPDGRAFRVVEKISGRLDTSWLGPWTWSRDGSTLFYAARVEQSPPPR
jgi:dipeptidyl aminopeptidase/acylaminoacyl peptidase